MDTFDLYFTSVASFQYHPRASLPGARVLNLEECAEVALRMLEIRKKHEERIKWLSSQD